METEDRIYDRASDKEWSSQVYQKAKEVVKEVLTPQGKIVPFADILEAMRQKHPALCDESIRDATYPKSPYWKHLVATAIQTLKKAGVRQTAGGWVWGAVKEVSPIRPLQPSPQPPQGQDIRQQLRERLLQLDHRQFENLVAKLLKDMGMQEVSVTGRTADGGIDAEGTIPIIDVKVAVQAKRYTMQNTVGIDPVQRLIGSVVTGGYDRGIFITTSSFTAGARETAERPDSRIVLVDGETLVHILIERRLGLKEIPVIREEIDEEFFSSATI